MEKSLVEFFQDIPVRKTKIGKEWWVSAVDTAKAIGYTNPLREANKIIQKNYERFEHKTTRSYVDTVEGGIKKKRLITLINLEGVVAFTLLSELPNAIPFQRWADKVLADHIEKRVKAKYGEFTEKTITARKLETAEWNRHGATGKDYAELTLLEYELLEFEEDKRKGNMGPDEILKLTISNLANTYQLRKEKYKVYRKGIENVMSNTQTLIDGMDNKALTGIIK